MGRQVKGRRTGISAPAWFPKEGCGNSTGQFPHREAGAAQRRPSAELALDPSLLSPEPLGELVGCSLGTGSLP